MIKSKPKLFSFLFPAFLFITLWNILIIGWNSYSTISEFNQNQTEENLKTQVKLFSQVIENVTDPATLQRLCEEASQFSSVRFSIFTPKGQLIADSQIDFLQSKLDLKFPEVELAMETGLGTSVRKLSQSSQSMTFVAFYNPNKLFLVRTGLAQKLIHQSSMSYFERIFFSTIISFFISLILAYFVSRKITSPIYKLTKDAKRYAKRELKGFRQEQYWDEFESLSDSMSKMAREIDLQIHSITLQKQESEAVLASMTEGVIALDTDSKLLSANQSAQDILQFKSKPLINHSFFDVVISNTLQSLVNRTRQFPEPLVEDFQLGQEDEYRIIEFHGSELKDLQGKAIGTLIVLHDVTQLRQFEQMRRDFVANVSHELRTPITSIQGFIETLLDDDIDAKDSRHFLGIVERQTKRLSSIIEDLLHLSRLDQMLDSNAIVKDWHKVQTLFQSADETCQSIAHSKNISLVFDHHQSVEVYMNIGLFEQALVNLINNAIKYSPENTRVSVRLQASDNGIKIIVQDQGPGIAIKHQNRLFERFFRVDKSRSRNDGGTGLGLAIVKHIARLHDSQAGVKSQLANGSNFYILLPHESVRNF